MSGSVEPISATDERFLPVSWICVIAGVQSLEMSFSVSPRRSYPPLLCASRISCEMALEDEQIDAWMIECRGGFSVNLSAPEKVAFGELLRGEDVTADMFVTSKVKHDGRECPRHLVGDPQRGREVGHQAGREGALSDPHGEAVGVVRGTHSRHDGWGKSSGGSVAGGRDSRGGGGICGGTCRDSYGNEDDWDRRTSVQFADTIPAGPEEKQDMEAQGASRSSQLVQMYISAQLGRVAGLDEYQGLAYQSHWSSAKGLKQVAKNPTGLGFRTLAQHLELAKSDGNLTAVDKFVQRTAEKFFLVGSTMWTRAGSRILARWTRAKTFRPEDGRIAATYFSMYWEEYPGRGIPDVLDSDLIRDAERAVAALDAVPDRGGGRSWGPPRGPPSDAGMSAGGSSWGGSSVSQANTSKLEELMSSLLGEDRRTVQSLATEVGSLKKGHGDLMSRMGQIRDKPQVEPGAAGKGRAQVLLLQGGGAPAGGVPAGGTAARAAREGGKRRMKPVSGSRGMRLCASC